VRYDIRGWRSARSNQRAALASPLSSTIAPARPAPSERGPVAQAEPDGYNLRWCFRAMPGQPAHLCSKLPYDSEKDFARSPWLGQVKYCRFLNSSPAKSVKEFVELARQGQLNYASGRGLESLPIWQPSYSQRGGVPDDTHSLSQRIPRAQQAVMTWRSGGILLPIKLQIRRREVALGVTSTSKRLRWRGGYQRSRKLVSAGYK